MDIQPVIKDKQTTASYYCSDFIAGLLMQSIAATRMTGTVPNVWKPRIGHPCDAFFLDPEEAGCTLETSISDYFPSPTQLDGSEGGLSTSGVVVVDSHREWAQVEPASAMEALNPNSLHFGTYGPRENDDELAIAA